MPLKSVGSCVVFSCCRGKLRARLDAAQPAGDSPEGERGVVGKWKEGTMLFQIGERVRVRAQAATSGIAGRVGWIVKSNVPMSDGDTRAGVAETGYIVRLVRMGGAEAEEELDRSLPESALEPCHESLN